MRLVTKLAANPKIYDTLRSFLEGGLRTQKQIIQNELKLKDNEKILDIGCGTGDYSIFFKSDQYIGLDNTETYIKRAQEKYTNKQFVWADATQLPFEDQTFDYIMIAQTLHHLSDEQVKRILKEARRVLRENGKLFVLDQHKASTQKILTKILQRLDEGQNIRTSGGYRRLIVPHFNIVRQYGARSRFYPLTVFVAKKNEGGKYDQLFGQLSPELSVIILCYQARELVREIVNRLEHALRVENINYELVLVGNYNQGDENDITPLLVKELAIKNPRIKCSARVKEGMMGWDMRTGFELATGKYIAVTDGDGQMPMEDIVRVYKKIKQNNYDLVKTYRTVRGDSLKRRIISKMYNSIFNILFPGLKIKDANSKPKIISRQAYRLLNLTSSDWSIDAEIMIQARRLGLLVEEIPTTFLKLEGRKSFIKFGAILEFISNLIEYRLKEFQFKK